jgi:hypothetical protein
VTEIIADEVKFLDRPKDGQVHGDNQEFVSVEEDDEIPF